MLLLIVIQKAYFMQIRIQEKQSWKIISKIESFKRNSNPNKLRELNKKPQEYEWMNNLKETFMTFEDFPPFLIWIIDIKIYIVELHFKEEWEIFYTTYIIIYLPTYAKF